jgi:hypothetical protein
MTDLRINRFTVRYQGKDYGPGSIIPGVPDDMANKLVVESNGTIEALPRREGSTLSDDDGADKESIILPSIDPAKTVK